MMKAYLSERNTATDGETPMRPRCCGHPADAYSEAARILEDAGEHTPGVHVFYPGTLTTHAGEMERRAHGAISEALAAFVGDAQ